MAKISTIKHILLEDINALKRALDRLDKAMFNSNPGTAGSSVNTSIEDLLKLYDVKDPKSIGRFLYGAGVIKDDPNRSKPKDKWIYYAYETNPKQRICEDIIRGTKMWKKNKWADALFPVDWNTIKSKTVEEVINDTNNVFDVMNTNNISIDDAEERMNIIGQNGNDGEHYDTQGSERTDFAIAGDNTKPEVIIKEVEVVKVQQVGYAQIYDEMIDENNKLLSDLNKSLSENKRLINELIEANKVLEPIRQQHLTIIKYATKKKNDHSSKISE
jgi:hypothetical protein